jgi:hypothetical protein
VAAERVALLALWACAADPTADPASEPPPTEPTIPCPPAFEPGIGALEHVPVAEGDNVPMVYPPTGSLHIQTSGRVAGMGDLVRVRLALFATDGSALSDADDSLNSPAYLRLLDHDGCGGVFTDVRVHLPYDPPAGNVSYCGLDGATFFVEWGVVSLLDEELDEIVTRLELVAALDPVFIEMFCP